MFYDYCDSGSRTESTYCNNMSAFEPIKLRQRVLVDMQDRSLKAKMVDQDVSMPVALAPLGLTGMQRADGEILAARAAEKFSVPYTLSTMSICSIEDIAEHTNAPFWFQLYFISMSLQCHVDCTLASNRFHFSFTSTSLRRHVDSFSSSSWLHFDCASVSL